MSLVPFSSRDSREVVLRHKDAIVVRDPISKQLTLRDVSSQLEDCPLCHRPLPVHGQVSRERETPFSPGPDSFVSPEYFRMLRRANDEDDDTSNPPSSPIRRLVQPALPNQGSPPSEAEFVASAPAASTAPHSIKRDAFSPNYFKRFFIEEKELGRGGRGVVLLVRHELDGVSLGHFACKRVPVGDDHAWLEKVLIEVQLLQGLSHPNLVSYRHVWLEDLKVNTFSPSVPYAFILQQYCNTGDLLHYIIGDGSGTAVTNEQLKEQRRRRSRGETPRPNNLQYSQRKLAFDQIYSFFKDIASGLAHLHASNYIHRDLKPSNCLLHHVTPGKSSELRCLISDFGEVQAEHTMRQSTGATGTISYCAPEVLRQDASGRYGNFTTKSDIFSLGMILYFMCFGRLPYTSSDSIQEEFEDLDQLRAEISSWSGFREERQARPDLPDQLYDFLKVMLAIDPAVRPNATDILQAIKTGSGLNGSSSKHVRTGSSSLGVVGKRLQPIETPDQGSSTGTVLRRVASPAYLEDAHDDSASSTSSSSSSSSPSAVSGKTHTPSNDVTPLQSPTTMVTAPLLQQQQQQMMTPSQPPRLKSGSSTPPLLLPPPSTRLGNLRTQVDLCRHHARQWWTANERVLLLLSKVVVFMLKMWTLTRPCGAAANNPAVFYTLVGVAAADIAVGAAAGLRFEAALGVLHLFGVWLAGAFAVLCEARNGGQIWTSN